MEGDRKSGTVKWFSRVKGYGFLAPDDEDTEIFVHFTGIEGEGYRNLEKGQKVSFVVEDTEKGPQAVAVRDQGIEATSWTAEPTDEPMDMDMDAGEDEDSEPTDEPMDMDMDAGEDEDSEPTDEPMDMDMETGEDEDSEPTDEPMDMDTVESGPDEDGEEDPPDLVA